MKPFAGTVAALLVLGLASLSAGMPALELRDAGPEGGAADLGCRLVLAGAHAAERGLDTALRAVSRVRLRHREDGDATRIVSRVKVRHRRKSGVRRDGHSESFGVRETDEIRRTLRFGAAAGSRHVVVDNLNGSITVAGGEGDEVQLVARVARTARSQDKLAEARTKVRLDIEEGSDTVRLYVDAPQRCRDGSVRDHGDRWYGYHVRIDFELRVPRDAAVELRTVNQGDIAVEGVRGGYDVENVNGKVDLADVAGPGRAYALNGGVNVLFDRNPDGPSYFGSLNGDVEVAFRRDLSADLRLKTFNGEVYTDFEVEGLPGRGAVREQADDGKTVFRYDKTFGVRVGRGGPELEFDAFNGDIRIVNRDQ